MYGSKWFETVTDDVLSTEREKVRLDYCASGDNFSEASRLQNLLWRFDKEMSKRAWEFHLINLSDKAVVDVYLLFPAAIRAFYSFVHHDFLNQGV